MLSMPRFVLVAYLLCLMGTCPIQVRAGKKSKNIQKIEHIGTSQAYFTGSDIYRAEINVPVGAEPGDLLILVLHRTDDYLPLVINNGWKRAAECFKTKNPRSCASNFDCTYCSEQEDLVNTTNIFCEKFKSDGQFGKNTDGPGRDLAQALFYKVARKSELKRSNTMKINFSPRPGRTNPAWTFLSVIRGADKRDPIRDWNATGDDDSLKSVFPSVYGKKGDLVLLSQGFDSGAPGVKKKHFFPPRGFEKFVAMFDCDNRKSRKSREFDCDESGYLFGKVLEKSGDTGTMTTRGIGKSPQSDSLVSVTIIPKGGTKDKRGRGAREYLGSTGRNCPRKRKSNQN